MRTALLTSTLLLLASVSAPVTAAAQERGCRGSGFSCEDLRYYCQMGDQAPHTVRRYCGGNFEQRGYTRPETRWRADRGYVEPELDDDDDAPAYMPPRRYSYRELQYYCAQGDQTPRTIQPLCFRFGLR